MKQCVRMSLILGVILSTRAFSADISGELSNSATQSFEGYESMHVYNLIPSEKSENLQWALGKAKAAAAAIDPATLPSKIDFSHLLPTIHNQGRLGSCTGQAITGAMEMNLSKQNAYTLLSPLFVYYNERKLMGTVNEDSGSSLADGVRAICTWGSCTEPTWSYSDDGMKFKVRPPKDAYREGRKFMDLDAITHSQIPHTLTAIKAVLAQNTPVVFGVFVYPSFEKAPNGKIPMPAKNEYVLGGHALTFVGYDDATQEFKFVNSWGREWGDKGCGYLKYDYVMNKSDTSKHANYFFANDIWSVNKIGRDEDDEDSPRGERREA